MKENINMKCKICGAEYPDSSNFCPNCGTYKYLYPDSHQQGTNFNNNQNSNQAMPPNTYPIITEKKKPNGCLITLAIIGGIFLLFVLIGIIGSATISDTDNNLNNTDVEFVFDNSIIYNENNIKIEAISSSITSYEATVNLYIENNTDEDKHIYIAKYAINGIMINDVYSSSFSSDSINISSYILDVDIASGKKTNCSISIPSTALKKYNMNEIQYVAVLFEFSGLKVQTPIPTILKTNKYNKPISVNGNEIYNDKEIVITESHYNDKSVEFALYNNSNNYIEFDLEDVSINDWAYDSGITVYNEPCFPYCVNIFSIAPDDDFFNKNNINGIDNIEFKLDIQPNGDYKNEFTTPVIKAEFN